MVAVSSIVVVVESSSTNGFLSHESKSDGACVLSEQKISSPSTSRPQRDHFFRFDPLLVWFEIAN